MNRKPFAAITAALICFGLPACGSAGQSESADKGAASSQQNEKKTEPKPQPADLTGTWKQTNSNSTDSWMEATVTADTIEVYWMGTDTKSLYWKGTYTAPTEAGDWKWTSQGDTDAMNASLLGSQDPTKDFTYNDTDGISWQTAALGTTVTVKTAKQ